MTSSSSSSSSGLYDRIIDEATVGGAGRSHQRLAEFVDRFHHRLPGSQQLEEAIDWTVEQLRADGLSVQTEEFEFPGWRRGEEEAELQSPTRRRLAIVGLGHCAPTPDAGLLADCVVVRSFEELRGVDAGGKVVVFNQSYEDYDTARLFRNDGPAAAAALGAAAALVRSVTPFSVDSPHAGVTLFKDARIPAASITVEDAEMLQRMQDRGERLQLRLRISSAPCGKQKSRNIVADLPGAELPQELVVVCAHIDAWDLGVGAMDDGGGMFAAWEALRLLQRLRLRPRRTVRLVLFSAEEFGICGGRCYFQRHRHELADRVTYMLESDGGTFGPSGVSCSGQPPTAAELRRLLLPLARIGAASVEERLDGPDITEWATVGVPVGNLVTARAGQHPDFYFYFHHAAGDRLEVQDPEEMDRCVAVFAVVAMALGDADRLLPR